MISRRSKGTRKTRIMLGLLGAIVVAAFLALCVAYPRLERERESNVLAQAARSAMEERHADQLKAVEQARSSLPSDAPLPKTWTLAGTLKQHHQLLDADAGLLNLLATAYLSRNEEPRNGAFESIRGGVQAAVQNGTATAFVREVAAHMGSHEEMLKVTGDYLHALTPLTETERGLSLGLLAFTPQEKADSISRELEDEIESTQFMITLLSLRGLAELHAGEVTAAFMTCMHAYDLVRVRMQSAPAWFMFYPFPQEPDLLLERIADVAWRDAPLDANKRRQALDHIVWHPEWNSITQSVLCYTGIDNIQSAFSGGSSEVYRNLSEWRVLGALQAAGDTLVDGTSKVIGNPIAYAHKEEMLELVDALVGKPPYTTKAHLEAFIDGPARGAHMTRGLAEYAFAANERYWSRVIMADIARLVFALKDHKREHGAYPASLAGETGAAFPALPLDSEKGTPLEYRSDGQTFTIGRPAKQTGQAILWEAQE